MINPDGTTKVTQKVVEASKVIIPEWRGVGLMRRWFCELIDNTEIAGGRTDALERDWLLDVKEPGKKLEDFARVWKDDPRLRDRFARTTRALYVPCR